MQPTGSAAANHPLTALREPVPVPLKEDDEILQQVQATFKRTPNLADALRIGGPVLMAFAEAQLKSGSGDKGLYRDILFNLRPEGKQRMAEFEARMSKSAHVVRTVEIGDPSPARKPVSQPLPSGVHDTGTAEEVQKAQSHASEASEDDVDSDPNSWKLPLPPLQSEDDVDLDDTEGELPPLPSVSEDDVDLDHLQWELPPLPPGDPVAEAVTTSASQRRLVKLPSPLSQAQANELAHEIAARPILKAAKPIAPDFFAKAAETINEYDRYCAQRAAKSSWRKMADMLAGRPQPLAPEMDSSLKGVPGLMTFVEAAKPLVHQTVRLLNCLGDLNEVAPIAEGLERDRIKEANDRIAKVSTAVIGVAQMLPRHQLLATTLHKHAHEPRQVRGTVDEWRAVLQTQVGMLRGGAREALQIKGLARSDRELIDKQLTKMADGLESMQQHIERHLSAVLEANPQ